MVRKKYIRRYFHLTGFSLILILFNWYNSLLSFDQGFLKKDILFNKTSKIDVKTDTDLQNNACVYKKNPHDLKNAIDLTIKSLKKTTFSCKPILGNSKLYDLKYDAKNSLTNLIVNASTVSIHFKTSTSLFECSVVKFEKSESVSELLPTSVFYANESVIDSGNDYKNNIWYKFIFDLFYTPSICSIIIKKPRILIIFSTNILF